MRDILLFGDSLNDSFLLYAFESDKEPQQSHSRKATLVQLQIDEQIFPNAFTESDHLCVLSECSLLESCGLVNNSLEGDQSKTDSHFIPQQWSTLESITSAAAALRTQIANNVSGVDASLQLNLLGDAAMQIRFDRLSLHAQSQRIMNDRLRTRRHKSKGSASFSHHSSFDFASDCSLALNTPSAQPCFPPFSSSLTDYDILSSLSHSTMFGRIYLAQPKEFPSAFPVAIKCSDKLRIEKGHNHEILAESPENEIEVLRWISMLPPSPHSVSASFTFQYFPGQQYICRLLQAGEDSSQMYSILEHFSGGDLHEYLSSRQRLTEVEAKRFFFQILQALYYLHRIAKVAHLDLSLENVLLDAPQLNVFLCDFGVSVRLSYSSTAEEKEVKHPGFARHLRPGKPAYMSGELFSSRSFLPTSSDIYSLGVILIRLLCGRKSFGLSVPGSSLWRIMVEEGRMEAVMEILELTLTDQVKDIVKSTLCPESRRAQVEDLMMSDWLKEERDEAWKQGNSVLLHMNARDPKRYPRPQ